VPSGTESGIVSVLSIPEKPRTDRFIFRKDKTMSIVIDEKVEDGKMLLAVSTKYAAELAEQGTSAEDIAALAAQIDIVRGQVVNQKTAKGEARGATKEQNSAVTRSMGLIRRVKLMARSVFRKDEQSLSFFHVEQRTPKAVKSLRTELDYMKAQAVKYKTMLAKKGLKDADIEKFTVLEAELAGKDVEQEDKLRNGKFATRVRNEAVEALDDMMEDIRISAELAFENNASKLNEFKSIFFHRAAKKPFNGGQNEGIKAGTGPAVAVSSAK
jgi:hypothetical protein